MDKEDFLKAREDRIGLLMQSKADKTNIYIEGKDDYDFYSKFFNDKNPHIIKCFNKKSVLQVANIYNSIGIYKSIFFIDRDFDDNKEIDNVFITDYYNFESHVFSKENIENFLEHKYSLSKKNIQELIEFLNSEDILHMFHTEYERIVLNNGDSENKLISNQLNTLKIDENYEINYETLFTQKSLPAINSNKLKSIEMYNGKFIGNLIFGIFKTDWFNMKFKSDMRKFERQKLELEMIINCDEPKYVKDAIVALQGSTK